MQKYVAQLRHPVRKIPKKVVLNFFYDLFPLADTFYSDSIAVN